ncbi:MAG TPA: hypothetical protein DCE71_02955 [Parachlamydiales bacterium]|nr:hypothetical protein [Parachlamydiales bacterium]
MLGIKQDSPKPASEAEGLPIYEFLGAGKEKIVFEYIEGLVGINPQPGRERDLEQEYQKIQKIAEQIPDNKKKESKYLALDMTPLNPGDEFQYTAPKSETDLTKLLSKKIEINLAYDLGENILTGGAALHSAGFVHGDVKPDNIFIYLENRDRYIAKVADFGKAKQLNENEQMIMSGNASHSPPEQVLSRASDVYGFGLLLIRILEAGSDIEEGKSIQRVLPKKTNALTVFSRVVGSVSSGNIALINRQQNICRHIDQLSVSDGMKDLLKKMTSNDPSLRPSLEEALKDYQMHREDGSGYFAENEEPSDPFSRKSYFGTI